MDPIYIENEEMYTESLYTQQPKCQNNRHNTVICAHAFREETDVNSI